MVAPPAAVDASAPAGARASVDTPRGRGSHGPVALSPNRMHRARARAALLLALLVAVLAGPLPADDDDDLDEVSIYELTEITWRPGRPLPEEIEALDGERVRLGGFVALDTPEGSDVFRMINDSCGCGGGSKIHHFVEVTLLDDDTGYRPGWVELVGTLSVGEEHEDGFVTSVYRFEAEYFVEKDDWRR